MLLQCRHADADRLRTHAGNGLHALSCDKVIFDKEKKIAENMLPYRKKMQIVFQDPYASLDPRMTVGDIIGEAIDVHKLANSKQERYDIIIEMLRRVGLNSPPVGSYRRSRVLPVVVLPHPDSPTSPRVSPRSIVKETSSTA